MKKPFKMSTRKMVAAFTKMNNALVYFPGATESDKYTKEERVERLEWAVPQIFRDKFETKGYVPTDHPMKKFIKECKIIEHSQENECRKSKKKKGNWKKNKR